jgi:arsenate reductase-like glutaredoxin family protein
MNDTKNSSAGAGLGVAGLILGILSIPFGIIPCTAFFALIMGVLGIILSAVGYSQARQVGAQTGLILAALIISILGTSFSLIRLTSSVPKSEKVFEIWKDKMNTWNNESDEIERSFNDAFKEGFEQEYEGNLKETLNELEKNLDELESELESADNELDKNFEKLSDEEKARKLGKATGKALKGFVDEMNDTSETEK